MNPVKQVLDLRLDPKEQMQIIPQIILYRQI